MYNPDPDRERSLTVRDLMAALAELDPSKPVLLQGCDCAGWLSAVVDDDENISLERFD